MLLHIALLIFCIILIIFFIYIWFNTNWKKIIFNTGDKVILNVKDLRKLKFKKSIFYLKYEKQQYKINITNILNNIRDGLVNGSKSNVFKLVGINNNYTDVKDSDNSKDGGELSVYSFKLPQSIYDKININTQCKLIINYKEI